MKQYRRWSLVSMAGMVAIVVVSLATGSRSGAAATPVAQWRFLGAGYLQGQSSAPMLASFLTGTNSGPAGERLGTNLAKTILGRLGRADVPIATPVFAPLILDLLRHESAGEMASTGWKLTVKLPAERWPAWQQAGGLLGGLGGNSNAPGSGTLLVYTNGWLTAGVGTVPGQGWMTLSNGAVLAAEGDLARIFDGHADNWPRVRVGASFQDNRVVTRADLEFLKPPLQALPEWKLPERMAHGPFSQFTAARGIGGLASRIGWWRDVFAGKPPEQAFWWSQPEVPFRNWFAVPTKDPAGDLARLYAAAGKIFGESNSHSGRLVIATNRSAFAILDTLQGLQPAVGRVKQGDDTFLLGTLYSAAKTTNPISANLRRLLAEKDMVLQDAEFTPEAVDHWNILFQLNQMLQRHLPNARNARAHAWLLDNRSYLGESETSVRQVTPTRLSVERRSSVGATGLELILLTRWLDGDDYQMRRVRPPPMPPESPKSGNP